jgi:competence protein ComEC
MKARTFAVDLITFLALAFICGIGASAWSGCPAWIIAPFAPPLLVALATLLLLLAVLTRNSLLVTPFLIALFFVLGLHAGIASSRPPGNDALAHLPDGEEALLFGHVAAMPRLTARGSQAEFDVVAVRRWPEAQPRPAGGRVLVRLFADWPENCSPGAFAVVRAKLEKPRAATIPGGFDQARYLAEKGIWRIALLRAPGQIAPADGAGWWSEIRYFPELLRYRTGLFLDRHLPAGAAALYRAILIGDGSRLNDASVEAFIASGTMHIMVISGSHIALLSLLCFAILYWFFRRFPALILFLDVKKLAWLGCLPLLALYSLLAGGESPVMRALVMCAIAACALFYNRVHAWPPLIALAALLLLLVNQQSLFAASFQLSFVAVLSLLAAAALFAPAAAPASETSWPKKAGHWLSAALTVVVAATVGTAPLTIAIFHRLSLVGPLATLLVDPVLSFWSLPLGFAAMPLMAVFPDAAALLLRLGEYGLIVSEKLAFFFAGLPFASLHLAPPPTLLFVSYYAGLILFVLAWRWEKRLAWFGVCLTVISVLVFFSPLAAHLQPDFADAPKIAVLDVGQGSATVIHTGPGRAFVIDGGGPASARQSVGISRIAPYLWRHGVTRLGVIAITHADADHCNGIAFLLEHFAIDVIWVHDVQAEGENFQALLAVARQRGVAIHEGQAGDSVEDGGMRLTCLANLRGDGRNGGLVLRFQSPQLSTLFPGDIDAEMEARLITDGVSLASDVLLAAHHGSRSSNSAAFFAAARPRLVVVSASAERMGMFPSTELMARCQANHLPLVTTGKLGSIFLRWRGGGFSYDSWPPVQKTDDR